MMVRGIGVYVRKGGSDDSDLLWSFVMCRQYNVGGSVGWTSSKEHVEFVRGRKDTKRRERKEWIL
jgi:hypothetical protein